MGHGDPFESCTQIGKHLDAECREQVSAIRSELQGDILAAGTRPRDWWRRFSG